MLNPHSHEKKNNVGSAFVSYLDVYSRNIIKATVG